jgi:hypothetical protein
MQIAHRLSRTGAGGDIIRRRWNNLESIKDSAESDDECLSRFDDRDIVRSGVAWSETAALSPERPASA